MLFQLKGKLRIQENKKTILLIDKGKQDSYTHVYGPARVLIERLKDQFNIIYVGSGLGISDNYYEIKREVTKDLYRKVHRPDFREENFKTIDKWMMESFKDLPPIDYVFLGTDDFFRLPLTYYVSKKDSLSLHLMQNEYFDYIGNDERELSIINKTNKNVVKNWDRYASPFAFSTQDYSIFMRLIDHLNRHNKIKEHVVGFSIDPAIYKPFFDELSIPAKFFYFADDSRGTRDFKQMDISQLQHIVFDNEFKSKNNDAFDDWDEPQHQVNYVYNKVQQDKNLFFAGTIFQDKGSRQDMWDLFLKDLKSQDCSFYIPLRRNGINRDNGGRAQRLEITLKENENYTILYNQVKRHKSFKGSILPHELNGVTAKYKYGLILRCVSVNDSLNFRPVLYTYMNILPFLDFGYDPEFLQIPKHIQDKIVVHNSKEIDEKIEYFNNNPDEKQYVLEELRELFKIDGWENRTEEMIQREICKIL